MKAKLKIMLAGAMLAVLAFAISFAAPRRTEGTVAAAVQVMNSYVPAEVENSSRTRFEYFTQVSLASPSSTNPNDIPVGKRLVIDFVSGNCNANPSSSVFEIFLNSGPALNYVHAFVPINVGYFGGPAYAFSQSTHIYVEPGETFAIGGAFSGELAGCDIYVTGFLVNA